MSGIGSKPYQHASLDLQPRQHTLAYRLATPEIEMKIKNTDKLILTMLSEIMEHLEIDGDIDPKFVQSAINSGNLWGLKWQYPGIFAVEATPESIVNDVGNYLDMWVCLEEGCDSLSDADREKVATEAEPFGPDVQFRGFDGNNETTHIGAARFLIHDLGRFSRFADRDLNSHAPSIDGYQRMYQVFEPIRRTLANRQLRTDEIIQILQAWRYPES